MKGHVADWRTRVYCVRIEPANDSPVIRLTAQPTGLKMSNGEVYLAEHGYEFSGFGASSTFASSSIDLKGIVQQGAIDRDDLMAGVYDNARVYLFATSWEAPIEHEEPLGMFFFGKVETTDEHYSVQLMSGIDVLSQSPGRSYSPACQWTFLDQTLDGIILPANKSRCIGPRSAPDGPSFASLKVTGTLTSVTDQYYFTDSARTEAADYFATGSIRFLTGPNAGLKPIAVKAFTSGVIQLQEALFYMPAIGDQYEMIPGCRKRPEDCLFWANMRNFGGHPHVPAPSQYGQVGRGA
ncbi:DUF2163 domain-containing protein [Pseudomonas resinovorans]|uniref:DUF2163 domain-containing protein n=1 Tax=Metapseudomonas resinovorans TaxID=53412 RepID=A0ABT4Y9C1_METRE|nr:DUF2163 domain-containing protein [Pseudomonas resinovorans]MDA8485170.1 DUF2163 domain-containing protein [Pseudomonas resinovorans]